MGIHEKPAASASEPHVKELGAVGTVHPLSRQTPDVLTEQIRAGKVLGVDTERGHLKRGGRAVSGWPVAQMGAVAVNKCVPVASRDSFAGVHKSQSIAAEVGGPGIPGAAPCGLACGLHDAMVTVIRNGHIVSAKRTAIRILIVILVTINCVRHPDRSER